MSDDVIEVETSAGSVVEVIEESAGAIEVLGADGAPVVEVLVWAGFETSPAGGATDSDTAALISNPLSLTRVALDPVVEDIAQDVVDETTQTPITLSVLYNNARA